MATTPDPVKNKEFKLVPAGTHLARCYQFIHIGHIPNTYPGSTSAIINKIRLTWELPEELTVFKEGEDAKPFSVSQDFTLSMNEKATLRKMVQSWMGKTLTDDEAAVFDAESLVGEPCLLTIIHKEGKDGKKYANVQNITKLPAKMVCPESVNALKIINWQDMTKEVFGSLPEFIQKKMQESAEYNKFAGTDGLAF